MTAKTQVQFALLKYQELREKGCAVKPALEQAEAAARDWQAPPEPTLGEIAVEAAVKCPCGSGGVSKCCVKAAGEAAATEGARRERQAIRQTVLCWANFPAARDVVLQLLHSRDRRAENALDSSRASG